MPNKFYEDDEEYVELVKEYERYIRSTPGAYEDFDEWFELEYGKSRNKTTRHSKGRNKKGPR